MLIRSVLLYKVSIHVMVKHADALAWSFKWTLLPMNTWSAVCPWRGFWCELQRFGDVTAEMSAFSTQLCGAESQQTSWTQTLLWAASCRYCFLYTKLHHHQYDSAEGSMQEVTSHHWQSQSYSSAEEGMFIFGVMLIFNPSWDTFSNSQSSNVDGKQHYRSEGKHDFSNLGLNFLFKLFK